MDFLINHGGEICPVEVRSRRSNLHASLDRFIEIHSGKLGQPYILHSGDVRIEGDITLLPVYMAIYL